uniref:G protein-coupled receptor n=1 Tax=Panagrolaimus superbus TaxID=310955 RepID=A0A914XTV7_9BILA
MSYQTAAEITKYAYHISPSECRSVIIRWKCLLLRIPGFSPIICFSLLHLFIFLERCCATFFLKTYENAPKRYGYAAVALLLTIFGLWVFYIFYDEDLFRYNPYCGATSATSAPRILNTYYIMLALDAGCTIGDFWLLWLSKKRMNLRNAFATSRHLRTMPEYYQLSQSYQLRENKVTTALVFPFVTAHSLVFFTYLILTTTFRLTIGNGTTPVIYTTSVEGAHVVRFSFIFL